jgi:hypothetical protein
MTRRATSAVIAATLLIAGCSPESVPPEPTGSPAPSGAPAAHGSLAECLRDHGIDEPANAVMGPPAGVDQVTWDQAMKLCSPLGPGPGGS